MVGLPFQTEVEVRASDWWFCFSDLQVEPQYQFLPSLLNNPYSDFSLKFPKDMLVVTLSHASIIMKHCDVYKPKNHTVVKYSFQIALSSFMSVTLKIVTFKLPQ